ncbi:restriction endonuclease subunit S [Citrobacter koseri]
MMSKQNRKQGDKSQAMYMTAVPVGYKQTEVGIIPEDWIVVPFFDVVSIASGQVSPICEPYCSMVLVAPDHIEAGTGLLISKQTAKEQNAISGKYVFHPGDTLYSKIRPYLKKAIYANFNGLCSADMYPLRPKEGIEPKFILPLILGERFSKYAESVSARSGMPKINRAEIADFLFVIPSQRKEQTAISNVLSDADKLIIALEKMIAKKLAIKIATMQQLLTGRTRLPQFAKHPDGTLKGFTSSELGLIPEDWIISPLSQMGHVLRGVSYNGSRDLYPHDTDDSVRLFRSNNIYNSKIDLANLQYVTKTRVAHHQLMNGGDILICMANGSKNLVGKAAIYNIEDGHKYTFGAFMGVFRTFTEVESLYTFYLLTSDMCRCYIDLALAGSSINNLKPSDIEQFTFALPNSEEQKAIATILSDMDAELEALEQKLAKFRDIKQGMMQQLLTGRIRLPLEQQP